MRDSMLFYAINKTVTDMIIENAGRVGAGSLASWIVDKVDQMRDTPDEDTMREIIYAWHNRNSWRKKNDIRSTSTASVHESDCVETGAPLQST